MLLEEVIGNECYNSIVDSLKQGKLQIHVTHSLGEAESYVG
jgi:hypothetical protein